MAAEARGLVGLVVVARAEAATVVVRDQGSLVRAEGVAKARESVGWVAEVAVIPVMQSIGDRKDTRAALRLSNQRHQ